MTITKDPTPNPTPSGGGSAEQKGADQFNNTATAGTGKVWMPGGYNIGGIKLPSNAPESAQQFSSGSWMTKKEAETAYYTWTQAQRDSFRSKALVAGLLKFGDGDVEAGALWKNLADQASNYGAQDQAISPMDLLAGYVKANTNGSQWVRQGDFEVNQLTGEKRYVGPQFKTTTASRIDLTDPATARAIATQLFQQLLGRDPGQGEISSYANALSQSEAQNPSVQTTTTQYDMKTGDATNTSTVAAGGLTADAQAQLAADQIKKKPEYATTQAVTTYQNAFDAAVYGSQS